MATAASAFDPARSQVSEEVMARFLAEPWRENIMTVPGIGPVARDTLAKAGVHTPVQLLASFLLARGPGVSREKLCEAFRAWLEMVGVKTHRATIVIAVAEKADVCLVGVFNP